MDKRDLPGAALEKSALITVSATPDIFSGPARTRIRSNSFPARKKIRGGLHSGFAQTMIKAEKSFPELLN